MSAQNKPEMATRDNIAASIWILEYSRVLRELDALNTMAIASLGVSISNEIARARMAVHDAMEIALAAHFPKDEAA